MSNWAIGSKKIGKFLEEANYHKDEYGYATAINDFIILRYSYDSKVDKYELDYALQIFFDRWANSGYHKEFDNEDELINFLKDERNLISSALNELTSAMVEYYIDNGRKHALKNFIEKIYKCD